MESQTKSTVVSPTDWIEAELDGLSERGLLRHLGMRQSPQVAGLVQIDDRQFVNFGANDYLGLAADERLVDAVRHAVGQLGWGSGASPLVSGHGVVHARLERELAEFEGSESALLFGSGFAANVGTITALTTEGDQVFSDARNHASIIDGCRLSKAAICVYRHNDVDHLRELIEAHPATGRRLIVTDSLFSMDGDFAPLRELADLAEQVGAMMLVDEAHATGVHGEHGRGICELLGLEERIDVRIGTLSKALGSSGGFVVARRGVVDWIANRARTYVFSTAMPETVAAAGIAALRIVRDEPDRRRRVMELSDRLRQKCGERNIDTGHSCSQIVPIIIGDPTAAVAASEQLAERGMFAPAIRPPTVPQGNSLLRISVSASHTEEMIDTLVAHLAQIIRG